MLSRIVTKNRQSISAISSVSVAVCKSTTQSNTPSDVHKIQDMQSLSSGCSIGGVLQIKKIRSDFSQSSQLSNNNSDVWRNYFVKSPGIGLKK